MPSLVSLVVEPVLGLASVTWRRRALVLGGGVAFAAALALAAGAPSFWVLLAAFSLLYPASGAFVSLSQAALMDLEPERHEENMARWTFAGAVGVVLGPLLLAGFALAGLDWRALFLGFSVVALGLVVIVRRSPESNDGEERPRLREALRAITRREVFRWLFLLELSDLLLDVLLAYLALYFVDVAGASRATGGLAVAVWSGAGLVGAAAVIPLLRRVDGLRYLRTSAVVTAVLFAAFLLVPSVGREARARGRDRGRQRRLVLGAAGPPLRRAGRWQRPRPHRRRALPAQRRPAARNRRAGRALGPRRRPLAAARRAARAPPVRPTRAPARP